MLSLYGCSFNPEKILIVFNSMIVPYDVAIGSLGITLWSMVDVVVEGDTLPGSIISRVCGDEEIADYSSIIDKDGEVKFAIGELQSVTELTISLRACCVEP